MKLLLGISISLFICSSIILAKPSDKGSRVHDGKLSDEEHFSSMTGEHNKEYDHDAFLGSEKKEFDKLTPTESKRRLGLIVDRIDKNKDGKISKQELVDWIRFAGKRWLYDDRDRLWAHLKKRETYMLKYLGDNVNPDAKADPETPVTWETWKLDVYGEEVTAEEEDKFYNDKKLWEAADTDKDGKLSKDEFAAMIHPHQFEHMKHFVLEDAMKQLDTDNDGYVSMDEYIDDILKHSRAKDRREKEKVIKSERKHFVEDRDKDKDGRLKKEEVAEYVFPSYDHTSAEADHLISHADKDKDGMLTKDEVLAEFNFFVGSTATEFGKGLKRHEEF